MLAASSDSAPLPTPWAAFGLLILGVALVGLAARADPIPQAGAPGRRRATALVLAALGVASLAASVVAAMLT